MNTVITDKLRNHPQVFLGALGIFLYVGAEVAIGSFLINYFQVPAIGNLTARSASVYVSLYWGGAMIGRFIGSAVLRRFSTGLVLGISATIACLLVVTSMLTFGHVAMATIIAVGFFNSIMFPSIFTLGIAGLGPLTGRGSSLMVAAIVGGAIIPLLQGKIADSSIGIHHAFILPVICYIYISAFGFTRPRTVS
jgi:FHS family L-fucose permease-like MFS transporter